ncbi:exodeoxyribonuclease V subunit alpha [Pigmentiphaga soli]|uniref:RecBCD enzyme subunit RecD n=1 Tax=Pigmentiphaga soli TaxID=1007095 RepID=A0ABP8GJC0_9BURK
MTTASRSRGVSSSSLPRDAAELRSLLGLWVERGWLRTLDRALAEFFLDLRPETDVRVALAAALASGRLGHGHVCLDLEDALASPGEVLPPPPDGGGEPAPWQPQQVLAGQRAGAWLAALRASPLVEAAGGGTQAAQGDLFADAGDPGNRPLVLCGPRLYLRRYWRYERQVVEGLRARLLAPAAPPPGLRARLDRLFGPPPPGGMPIDWQKLACAIAARGAFGIITGGPGTGKTTTVVRLLAVLQEPAVEAGRPLRVRLAAPTGKAAARLSASIGEQIGRLDVAPGVRAAIPADVVTVHRLLGRRAGSRQFRHHAGRPLPLDVLVVDEASMVDLEMMASLLDALPPDARLVLIGDKDQLASVEAGAVLGDLCRDAEEGRYGASTRQWLEAATGLALRDPRLREGDAARHLLAQQTVMLRDSRRFGPDSGIGRLARSVNAGDPAAACAELQRLADSAGSGISLLSAADDGAAFASRLDTLLLDGPPGAQAVAPGHAAYLHALRDARPVDAAPGDAAWEDWARAILAAFDRFRVLCAVRQGDHGVVRSNQRIARLLRARGLIEREDGWYEGRPVLVTRNDPATGLVNGDIGIALELPAPGAAPALRVAFLRGDGGGVRFVLPSRLGAVETAYAMTVHKSQGSEFAHTALLLPDSASPVLTRELVYTGITRAAAWFTLVEAAPGVFGTAVGRRVRRASGLDICA